jgi:ribosomal protein S1
MLDDFEKHWQEVKQNHPIDSKLYGKVLRIEPFGIFLDIGYPILKGYQFSGLVDILTKDDEDSYGLPMDYDLWPKVGEKIYCKVRWHRELEKEISLAIVRL